MQVKDFETIADSYVPRGERRFSSPRELAVFFRTACDCTERYPDDAPWIAEVASGVTAQADDLLRQDDDLDAVHVLFIELMAEINDLEQTRAMWAQARRFVNAAIARHSV